VKGIVQAAMPAAIAVQAGEAAARMTGMVKESSASCNTSCARVTNSNHRRG
jgi:hypothetical protein